MTTSLTDDELAEIREIFTHFDADKNGTMDARELSKLMTTLAGDEGGDHLDAALAVLDENGNGVIDLEEFIHWWGNR